MRPCERCGQPQKQLLTSWYCDCPEKKMDPDIVYQTLQRDRHGAYRWVGWDDRVTFPVSGVLDPDKNNDPAY